MSTDISTLNTSNFAELAQAMGMEADTKTKKQTSTLARLKIDHKGVMGETEIKGKKKKVRYGDGVEQRVPGLFPIQTLFKLFVPFSGRVHDLRLGLGEFSLTVAKLCR